MPKAETEYTADPRDLNCLEIDVRGYNVLKKNGATLQWVLGASREDLIEIPGMGATSADKVLRAVVQFKDQLPAAALDACLRALEAIDAIRGEVNTKLDAVRGAVLLETRRLQAAINDDARRRAKAA